MRYDVSLGSRIAAAEWSEQNGVVLDQKTQRISFRRVRIVQDKLIDQEGFTFLFEVNNVRIFCGGRAPKNHSFWSAHIVQAPTGFRRIHSSLSMALISYFDHVSENIKPASKKNGTGSGWIYLSQATRTCFESGAGECTNLTVSMMSVMVRVPCAFLMDNLQ